MRICLSIFCLMSCIFSSACGSRRDPVTYFGVQFVNPEVGWIKGPGLYLFKTLDGGKTWEVMDKRGGGVQFIDAQYGWRMIGSELLHTIDGGLTWQTQLSPDPNAFFSCFHFVDGMNGWVIRNRGMIFHTSDGGNTWEQQSAKVKVTLVDVNFVNTRCGWIVGHGGTVLRTCDEGLTWEKVNVGEQYHLRAVQFVSESEGWAVGGAILHSSDGGKTWGIQAPLDSGAINVHFINGEIGWVVGFDGLILHTSDGGRIWVRQQSGTKMHLKSVWFIDENTGWAVGGWDEGDRYEDESGKPREGWFEGIILRTINGGQTWESVEPPIKRRRWF
jgi:photosystem II stability/assembly factor-like uncharacterized protein